MLGRVLVPLDGSPASAEVLSVARPLLRAADEVALLRVLAPARAGPDVQADEVDAAAREVAGLASALAAEGAAVRTVIDRGDPAERILAQAKLWGADLVALASHGRSGIARWVRGSVAERVLRHAEHPLLVTTPHARGAPHLHRILVPLGAPEHGREHRWGRDGAQILPRVAALAAHYRAEVVLLRVADPLATPLPLPPAPWDPTALRAEVEPLRARLASAGCPVVVDVDHGDPGERILAHAERADLIAMTSHGRRGPSRWLLGSVAEVVLRHAAQPLLIERLQP